MRRFGLLVLLVCSAGAEDDRPSRTVDDPILQRQIHEAIDRGVAYLKSIQARDGSWVWQTTAQGRGDGNGWDAGLTALALYSLAASGEPPTDPTVKRAVTWVYRNPKAYRQAAETYASSLLVLALTRVDARLHRKRIHELAERIVRGQLSNGVWDYRLSGGGGVVGVRPGARAREAGRDAFLQQYQLGDNSNAQFAVLALWAAYSLAAYDVPDRVWKTVRDVYAADQAKNGGWAYKRKPVSGGRTAVNMTAAGLVSWAYACAALEGSPDALDALRKAEIARKGLGYLLDGAATSESRFRDYYYVYSLERVGTVYDLPLDAWYIDGARRLIAAQDESGAWGHRVHSVRGLLAHRSRGAYETALALLFLTRGTLPPERGRVITPRREDPDGPGVTTRTGRIPDTADPAELPGAFALYCATAPARREALRSAFGRGGKAAVELFVARLRAKNANERRCAWELLETLVDHRFLFDPDAPAGDREIMLVPIETYVAETPLEWDPERARFVAR